MGPEADFLALIQQQFPEEIRHNISFNSKIRELKGWSSLQALIITVAIDEKYGIPLSDEDFRSVTTIHDLFTTIQNKIK
ncbi:MAG: acyl carrier protein [Flavobacteriales bacterium]|nr:acyl carrier protein [Flavobacteriales bacterium]